MEADKEDRKSAVSKRRCRIVSPPIASNTLLESLYAQLQVGVGDDRVSEGGNRGNDEHPNDKDASPSGGSCTSAYSP